METFRNLPAIEAPSRAEWRTWLQHNHQAGSSVWLILHHKSSAIKGINYNDAVEEALCFGWIDSVHYKRDSESSYLYFAKRKPKSNWSKLNRDRVVRLAAGNLIMPAGQKMIDLAKESGTWEALMVIENGTIPSDLQAAFDINPDAEQNFLAFSTSSKKVILEWILNAKRSETRMKRINETVQLAAQNKKAYPQ